MQGKLAAYPGLSAAVSWVPVRQAGPLLSACRGPCAVEVSVRAYRRLVPSTRAPDSGRFRARLDEPTLVEAVAEVCRDVRPNAPHTVSPSTFDERVRADASARTPRFADVPEARTVRRRLAGLGWYELLALIFDSDRSTEHYLALRRRGAGREVGEQECVVALQTIASRTGADTLRPHEFTAGRRQLIAEDARAWLHGTAQQRWFPTAAQVEGAFRTDTAAGWDRALAAAGLRPRTGPVGGQAGVPVVHAIELFLTEMGCLPWSSRPLVAFARAAGFSLAAQKEPWASYMATLRADRDALGLWTPSGPPPRGERPALPEKPEVDVTVRRRETKKWTELANLVVGVMAAYDLAADMNVTLTQPLHRQFAKENVGVIPSPSVVDRNAKKLGKTAAWIRDEAKRRRRQRQS